MKFDKLSLKAKQAARQAWIDDQGQNYPYDEWWNFDDFVECARRLGIDIDDRGNKIRGPAIYFSGFWSQGDGASFEGKYKCRPDAVQQIAEWAPLDETLNELARQLTALQARIVLEGQEPLGVYISRRGNYSHSGTMDFAWPACEDDEVAAEETKEVEDIMRAFADWMYRQLEDQYNYYFSDEYVDERLREDGIRFHKDGSII